MHHMVEELYFDRLSTKELSSISNFNDNMKKVLRNNWDYLTEKHVFDDYISNVEIDLIVQIALY